MLLNSFIMLKCFLLYEFMLLFIRSSNIRNNLKHNFNKAFELTTECSSNEIVTNF